MISTPSSPLLPACWPLCIAVNVLDNLRNLLMEEPPSHTLIIIVHIGSSHSQANMEYWDISPCPAGQHWTGRHIVLHGEKVDRLWLWLWDCTNQPACTAHYLPTLFIHPDNSTWQYIVLANNFRVSLYFQTHKIRWLEVLEGLMHTKFEVAFIFSSWININK